MITRVESHEGFESLALDVGHLYLILGYGTGDTFNALVHLAKAPPQVPYSLIIKKPQLDLVLFLLELFQARPTSLLSVDYWQHDFALQVSSRFPSLGIQRKFEPLMKDSGLVACWASPSQYNKILPHSEADIEAIRAYFAQIRPPTALPAGAVLLFPTAGTQFSEYRPNWGAMVSQLKQLGAENIFVNVSGIKEYGDEHIDGATPITLSHRELIGLAHNSLDLKIIGVRSGVLDILRFCDARALILYQRVPEGIFETCRFGLIPNRMDIVEAICLHHSPEHQDYVISYYIQNFLASSLHR